MFSLIIEVISEIKSFPFFNNSLFLAVKIAVKHVTSVVKLSSYSLKTKPCLVY